MRRHKRSRRASRGIVVVLFSHVVLPIQSNGVKHKQRRVSRESFVLVGFIDVGSRVLGEMEIIRTRWREARRLVLVPLICAPACSVPFLAPFWGQDLTSLKSSRHFAGIC